VAPLDNIPEIGMRPGIGEAMEMVAAAVEAMEPDGQLAERWDEFSGMILGWAHREDPITPEAMQGIRLQMEGVSGDGPVGEMLVATVKLGLSAVLLAFPNIFYILLEDRDPIHDDVAPLVEKGVNLLHKAKASDEFDPTVRIDYELHERLEKKKTEHREKIEDEAKKDWVADLIENAVRPEAQN
jgi:hypothetical protein